MRYDMLIDEIQKLSLEEKEGVQLLIQRLLIEQKRELIYEHYQESLKEENNGTLTFSSDVQALKMMLDTDETS
jgi:hypothetical protein